MVLTYEALGRRFKAVRERLGLSLADVGSHLGISAEGVRKIEKGTSRAPNGRLQQLADHLGLELVVHLIDPRNERAALWLRSIRFFAGAPDHVIEGFAAMIDAWERENQSTDSTQRRA